MMKMDECENAIAVRRNLESGDGTRSKLSRATSTTHKITKIKRELGSHQG